MSRTIQCPSCEKKLKLGEAAAKKPIIVCPACSQKIRINRTPQSSSSTSAKSQSTSRPSPQSLKRASNLTTGSSRPADPKTNQRQRSSGVSNGQNQHERSVRPAGQRNGQYEQPELESPNQAFVVFFMVGCVTAGILAFTGAIWWIINTLNDDGENQNNQNVAQHDSNDNVAESSATGMTESPDTPSNQQPDHAAVPPTFPVIPAPIAAPPVAIPPAKVPSVAPPATAPPAKVPPVEIPPAKVPPIKLPPVKVPPVAVPPANMPPVIVAQSPNALRYGFKQGDSFAYDFELDAEVSQKTVSYPGYVSFSIQKGRSGGIEEESGTGTGFVVSPDGYLMTCQHVVQDAVSIEVILNGKSYVGQVVAVDKDQDLALLKIKQNNLPFVSLADSGRVRLAEDVRAIGFPLTDLLGQGLKVTRGTISGINGDPESRRFQIDAQINPGNSGGPLFNEQGQVIGINSSKLISGRTISSVGFSIPVNYAKQLLQQNKVSFKQRNGGAELDGPELVQKVQPAVALLKVVSRQKINQQYILNFNGHYTDSTSNPRNNFPGLGNIRRPRMPFGPLGGTSSKKSGRGKVILDAYGAVESIDDDNPLPFVTGCMATLMIHEFDPDGAEAWTRENYFLLTKPNKSNGNTFGFPRPRFGAPFGNQQQEEPDEVLSIGMETHRYRILESNDREIKIAEKYEVKALDDPIHPMVKVSGTGVIIFDKKYAMPKSMRFRQTYEVQSEGKVIQVPMGISYRMQDPLVVKKRQAEITKANAKRKAEAEERAAQIAAMSNDERLDFYLAEIKANRGGAVYSKLAQLDVVESRRKEVCRLLAPCLKLARPNQSQVTALGHWATPDIVREMITKLESMGVHDWPFGRAIVVALGKTKDEQAIQPVAKKLTSANHVWRSAAQKALIELGPQAEDAVLAILEIKPTREAVKVLAKIGTQKSLSPLKKLASHNDFWVKRSAKEAITELALRMN